MNRDEEIEEVGENIVYRLEVYKLDWDSEHGVFCEELAFCTGYKTYEDAQEGVDYIDDLLEFSLDGWNPFTQAVIEKIWMDKGTRSKPLGRWTFSSENMRKLGKTSGELLAEGDEKED